MLTSFVWSKPPLVYLSWWDVHESDVDDCWSYHKNQCAYLFPSCYHCQNPRSTNHPFTNNERQFTTSHSGGFLRRAESRLNRSGFGWLWSWPNSNKNDTKTGQQNASHICRYIGKIYECRRLRAIQLLQNCLNLTFAPIKSTNFCKCMQIDV